MNIHQWKKYVNKFNGAFEENMALRNEWNNNTLENLHRFNKGNSIWNLLDLYSGEKEKIAVLVGASPCLAKDVEYLKELDDNFFIICANSAFPILSKHNIKPKFVICLDSDWIDIPQHLDYPSEGITLLASSCICSKALNNWKGPIYYQAYYSIDKEIRPRVRAKLGKKILGGGNSISQALLIATHIFDCKTVMFVGNEFCFDKDYYADSSIPKQETIKASLSVIDVRGQERWTLPSLFIYALWIDKACGDLTPPGFFIDTSLGLLGKTNSAVHSLELPEAIKRVKWSCEMKEKINSQKSDEDKAKLILSIASPEEPESEVLRYHFNEHRNDLIRLAKT